ncbi:hypothetical protein DFH08DRAFT_393737 [Mycena albidolilacea]|uniref:Secreted protein n=1 Tax=Mycena albidolilacea TaxID=1033008 RepID=A0AAD6ZE60_9AGAR|nr:hypothetical protein DFH08DRAFT_393737 [Mycena albidolilacea]
MSLRLILFHSTMFAAVRIDGLAANDWFCPQFHVFCLDWHFRTFPANSSLFSAPTVLGPDTLSVVLGGSYGASNGEYD